MKAPNNIRDLEKLVLATIRGPDWKPGRPVAARVAAVAAPRAEPKPEVCGHCAQTYHPWNPRHVEHHSRAQHMPLTRAPKAKRWR